MKNKLAKHSNQLKGAHAPVQKHPLQLSRRYLAATRSTSRKLLMIEWLLQSSWMGLLVIVTAGRGLWLDIGLSNRLTVDWLTWLLGADILERRRVVRHLDLSMWQLCSRSQRLSAVSSPENLQQQIVVRTSPSKLTKLSSYTSTRNLSNITRVLNE